MTTGRDGMHDSGMRSRRDPILVEVIRNELNALVDEMRVAIRKTGHSPLVKVGDFSTALCNRLGQGLGIGSTSAPAASLYRVAEQVAERWGADLRSGDLFLCNDPYGGGSHIPDVILVAPLFWREQHVAFASIYSHHSDMGGRFPGSQSGACTSIFEEGVRIPLMRLRRAGETNAEVLQLVAANVRSGDEFLGDLDAKIAGAWRAGENLSMLLDRYGVEPFEDCCDFLIATGERRVREAIRALPRGRFEAEVSLGDDGLNLRDPPIRLKVALIPQDDRLIVDFAGTDPQVAGGVNMPFENTRGVVLSSLREHLHPGVAMSAGAMRPVEIRAPAGSVVNPNYPASTTGRSPVFFLLEEVMQRALAAALPDRVPVPREGWDMVHFSQRRADGRELSLLDLCCGGWGGRPRSDGPDGLAGASTVGIPVEVVEREYPVRIEGFGLCADTAGPGRHRGSMGVFRKYRFLEAGHVMIRTNRLTPSLGLHGGLPGAASMNLLERDGVVEPLAQRAFIHLDVQPGDGVTHQVGGCGGFGDPATRDPADIRRDIRQGRITPAKAAAEYGAHIEGVAERSTGG